MRELRRGAQLANRYTLNRKLGAGFGVEIWVADDRLTRTTVALKIQAEAEQARDLLQREWQICLRLTHAHIVRAFEFHDEPDFNPPSTPHTNTSRSGSSNGSGRINTASTTL